MFKNITLEIGLKPFKETSDEFIKAVCRKAFSQWAPLLKERETISVLMWSSDGSELLDYSGDLDKEFEWCCFVGTANKPLLKDEPPETSLHERKQFYMDNPPKMTYRILQKIVKTFKETGKEYFPNSRIRVGTTFDIGPEFAISDFKYKRHPEVCKGTGCDTLGFIDATALLKEDNCFYAAYPNGIPDKTPMGFFLGAQANIFLKDMGFDYIWLSNGMGFCYEPWNEFGKIYDGKDFHVDKLPKTREKIFLFWKLFRDACPDFPIETRGTNYSVGIDYASDGVPLYDIYKGNFNITPPPNSPWAAINDDIGIEILGQLTRNCLLPGNDYMLRFYLHDIWWMNSPWYDRYEGTPYDIYIPMSLSRLDEKGKIQSPTLFNILSIDNSMGELPDICANEVIPHILKAEKNFPDEPSPLVLLYPLREYTTAFDEELLREMYFGDSFLRNALNCGLPLSTVSATDNFLNHDLSVYDKSVIIVPADIRNEAAYNKLSEYAKKGGKIIAYGTKNSLCKVNYSCQKIDINEDLSKLFKAVEDFGYSVEFDTYGAESYPSMSIHRSDNATFFSVYNRDTTVKTKFRFPLGAPILNGFSTRLENGYSTYNFNKWAHAECRVFVKQQKGTVRARELAPVNMKYRRKIKVTGLVNAEVCLFPENYCKETSIVANCPVPDILTEITGWEVKHDKENGTYLYNKNVTGDITLCMPRK